MTEHVCDPVTDPAGGPRTRLRVLKLILGVLDGTTEHPDATAALLEFAECKWCQFLVLQKLVEVAAGYAGELVTPPGAQALELELALAEAELAVGDADQ